MRILDRYVTLRLVRTVATALISLVALYVLFDLADHRRGDIIRQAVPMRVVAAYYLGWIPVIIVQMSPIALLLSTLYVLGMLAKNNELTAILAGGVNLRRATFGPICVAALLTMGIFALSEWVMPAGVGRARHIEQTYFKSKGPRKGQRLVWIEPGREATVSVKRYSPEERTGYDLLITESPADGLRLAIEADRMVWDSEMGTWILEDGKRTLYSQDSEQSEQFDREVAGIRFAPDQIESLNVSPDELSAGRLRRMLIELGRGGMVSPFIIVFLAIPFAARTARGGLAASLAISVAVGLGYVCSFSVCVGLAKAQMLPGWLGVWLANVAFLAGGLWMYGRMPT